MKAKLTVKNVSRLKPLGAGQTDYFDSVLPGFCLRVSSTGARSYCCTYRVNRKFVRQTIGPISRIGLAQARAKARQIYAVAEEGRDPRIERRAAVADAIKADADTYAGAVENFIQVYAIGKKKNRSHTEQRRLLLKVNERWHSRPVSSITKREVSDALDEMVTEGKGYAANRTFTVLSTFFKWLDQRDRVPINIMAKVAKPFDGEQPRTRVWSDAELKAIWKSADKLKGDEAIYLRLLLLLGQRRDEIAGMSWEELDLEQGTWTLPATRAKGKRNHTFPLPAIAGRLLRSVSIITPFVFPGRGNLGTHNAMAASARLKRRVQKASGVEDFTFHDARRTFRTGLDKLKIPPHVKDECLNHARHGVGDVHYSRYDYLAEMRQAFEAWADHISGLTHPKGVIGLRG
jgi:integrase